METSRNFEIGLSPHTFIYRSYVYVSVPANGVEKMSSFQHKDVEVPQRSRLHLLTGSIVLTFGSIGATYLLGWLLLV